MTEKTSFSSGKFDDLCKSEECSDMMEDYVSDGEVSDIVPAAFHSEQKEGNGGPSNASNASSFGELFGCPLCGKGFQRQSSLKQHSHVHSGNSTKHLTCVLCLRKYTQYPNLCRHWRTNHRVEHELLRNINVAIPRAVRRDLASSIFCPDAPGLIRNWSFPVPGGHTLATDSRLVTPFPLYGANYFLGSKVHGANFTEANISQNTLTAGIKVPPAAHTGAMFPTATYTGTKIPPDAHTGAMLQNATFTGYPSFPGHMVGGAMPLQFPSVLSSQAMNLQMNKHLSHAPSIGEWLGHTMPFGSAFPLLGLLPPTNLLASHATSLSPWSLPHIQMPFVSSSSMEKPEVAPSLSPDVRQTTSSSSTSSLHMKQKREEKPDDDNSNQTETGNTSKIPEEKCHLRKDGHPINTKFKVIPLTSETSTIPTRLEYSPDSSSALEKKDRLEQRTPSGTSGTTDEDTRIHRCLHCSKEFPSNANLKRHLRIHTGKKPYKCHECDCRFNISSNMRRHMNNVHRTTVQ